MGGLGGRGRGGGWRSSYGASWRLGTLLLSGLGLALLPVGWGVCFRLASRGAAGREGQGAGLERGQELLCSFSARLWASGRLEWAGLEVREGGGVRSAVVGAMAAVSLTLALTLLSACGAWLGRGGGRRRALLRLSVPVRALLLAAAAAVAALEGWSAGRAVLHKRIWSLAMERLLILEEEAAFRVWGWLLAAVFLYLALLSTLAESFAFCLDGASEDLPSRPPRKRRRRISSRKTSVASSSIQRSHKRRSSPRPHHRSLSSHPSAGPSPPSPPRVATPSLSPSRPCSPSAPSPTTPRALTAQPLDCSMERWPVPPRQDAYDLLCRFILFFPSTNGNQINI